LPVRGGRTRRPHRSRTVAIPSRPNNASHADDPARPPNRSVHGDGHPPADSPRPRQGSGRCSTTRTTGVVGSFVAPGRRPLRMRTPLSRRAPSRAHAFRGDRSASSARSRSGIRRPARGRRNPDPPPPAILSQPPAPTSRRTRPQRRRAVSARRGPQSRPFPTGCRSRRCQDSNPRPESQGVAGGRADDLVEGENALRTRERAHRTRGSPPQSQPK